MNWPERLEACAFRRGSDHDYFEMAAITSPSDGNPVGSLYLIFNPAAAVQNILLTAYSLGYGTCWVEAFDEEAAAKAIKTPPDVRPLAIIPIGRPAPTSRIPLSKIMHENRF